MAQLTYDELRLLRQLERGDQTMSDNRSRGGLNRLVDEGYSNAEIAQPIPNGPLNHSEGPGCGA
jgi:hypothetical protein